MSQIGAQVEQRLLTVSAYSFESLVHTGAPRCVRQQSLARARARARAPVPGRTTGTGSERTREVQVVCGCACGCGAHVGGASCSCSTRAVLGSTLWGYVAPRYPAPGRRRRGSDVRAKNAKLARLASRVLYPKLYSGGVRSRCPVSCNQQHRMRCAARLRCPDAQSTRARWRPHSLRRLLA